MEGSRGCTWAALKCTKMHQNGCPSMTEQSILNFPECLISSISRPHDPSMICSDFYPLYSIHLIKKWIILVTQDQFKTHGSVKLWWPFWCILVHFSAPHVWPYDPSLTYSDSFALSSVHLSQKLITLVSQDKFEMLCPVMVQWPFWCILVHFSALHGWPHYPTVLNFHQKHISYTPRAFKRNHSHLPILGNTDLTWALSIG